MKNLLAVLVAVLLAASPAAAAPVLEKVVILQRHGVRSPTKALEGWAQWPVAPGELTDHGAAALARMGDALHRHYARLLPKGD